MNENHWTRAGRWFATWIQEIIEAFRRAFEKLVAWLRENSPLIQRILGWKPSPSKRYESHEHYWAAQVSRLEALEARGQLLPRQQKRLNMARSNI